MKGKFISVVLTMAVCLGLLLVPAAVGVSAGDPPDGEATFQLPAEVLVEPNETFTVNVNIYNPHKVDLYTGHSCMQWSPGNLNATVINNSDWPKEVGGAIVNDIAEVGYGAGGEKHITGPYIEGVHYLNSTNITHCQVHFKAGSEEGDVQVNFVALGTYEETSIYDFYGDVCNWIPGDMQNMTVRIGTPELTLNVTPAGMGRVEIKTDPNKGTPTTYPDYTDWGWYDPVILEAVNSTTGWVFDYWSLEFEGIATALTTTVTMDDFTKNVTANFVAQDPELSVAPLSLPGLSARFGDNTDNDTVTISNTGGQLLKWAVGSPPTWGVGSSWTWNNSYKTDVILNATGNGSAGWSTDTAKTGSSSAHLNTGTTTQGDEGRIVIVPSGVTTLGDLDTLSWWVYPVAGYPPHVDIYLDCDGDGVVDPEDVLTAEINYNTPCAGWTFEAPSLGQQYAAGYNNWWQTFNFTCTNPPGGVPETEINNNTLLWACAFGGGPGDAPSSTLAHWKEGIVDGDPGTEMSPCLINSTTPVVRFEIEVDSWISWNDPYAGTNSEAYIDDIEINGDTYYLESSANTVGITVTNVSDPDVYEASVAFTPAAARVLNLSNPNYPGPGQPEFLYPSATAINGTVWVDKYSLDFVQQYAVLRVPALGGDEMVYATLDYDLVAGDAGWPYYVNKSWVYNINATLVTPTLGTIVEPTRSVVAVVTDLTNVTAAALGSVPLGMDCYETTHLLNGVTPFMFTYWNDDIRNFVVTVDGGTYNAPPIDVRSLADATLTTLPPIQPPPWLSFDKTSGSVGISPDSDDLLVTANASGKDPGVYPGKFTISAPGSIQEKTVDVTFTVLEATTIDVCRDLPGNALTPNQTYPGREFSVYISFHTPIDEFNAISLTDLAPDGWAVAVDKAWCDPVASEVRVAGNKVEIAWDGPYNATTPGPPYDIMLNFTARYNVTVPATPTPGNNYWPDCDNTTAWVEYWYGSEGAYKSYVSGQNGTYEGHPCDSVLLVTVPGDIVGETRDVNADLLPDTEVTLKRSSSVEDSDESTPDYLVTAMDTGNDYWLHATKDRYFDLLTKPKAQSGTMLPSRNPGHPDYLNFATQLLLSEGYSLNFSGDYGLIPRACTMSYAMESINHNLFIPIEWIDEETSVQHSEWQLSVWKAGDVIAAWQVPS